MWEKLEDLRACDIDGFKFVAMERPKELKSFGPNFIEDPII